MDLNISILTPAPPLLESKEAELNITEISLKGMQEGKNLIAVFIPKQLVKLMLYSLNFDEKIVSYDRSSTETSPPKIINMVSQNREEGMRKTFQFTYPTSEVIEEVDDKSSKSNQSKRIGKISPRRKIKI